MEIYPQNFHSSMGTGSLPESYSLYLCDTNGTLIYSNTRWNASEQTLQEYSTQLLRGIEDGSFSSYDSFFEDFEGVSRGAYYAQMENGWVSS